MSVDTKVGLRPAPGPRNQLKRVKHSPENRKLCVEIRTTGSGSGSVRSGGNHPYAPCTRCVQCARNERNGCNVRCMGCLVDPQIPLGVASISSFGRLVNAIAASQTATHLTPTSTHKETDTRNLSEIQAPHRLDVSTVLGVALERAPQSSSSITACLWTRFTLETSKRQTFSHLSMARQCKPNSYALGPRKSWVFVRTQRSFKGVFTLERSAHNEVTCKRRLVDASLLPLVVLTSDTFVSVVLFAEPRSHPESASAFSLPDQVHQIPPRVSLIRIGYHQ